MVVAKAELLDSLKRVQPAVSSNKDFVWCESALLARGEVLTFDGQMGMVAKGIDGIEAVVPLKFFADVVASCPGDTVDITLAEGGNQLVVKSDKGKTLVNCCVPSMHYADIQDAFAAVESAEELVCDDLKGVLERGADLLKAAPKFGAPALHHIHITSDLVEVTDGTQLLRTKVKGVAGLDVLLHARSIAKAKGIEYNSIRISDTWASVSDDATRCVIRCAPPEGYPKMSKAVDELENDKSCVVVTFPDAAVAALDRVEAIGATDFTLELNGPKCVIEANSQYGQHHEEIAVDQTAKNRRMIRLLPVHFRAALAVAVKITLGKAAFVAQTADALYMATLRAE